MGQQRTYGLIAKSVLTPWHTARPTSRTEQPTFSKFVRAHRNLIHRGWHSYCLLRMQSGRFREAASLSP
jgi:hypothetical protein